MSSKRSREDTSKPRDYVTEYAREVVDGRIVVGRLVRLACERHLNDLATAEARGMRFDLPEAHRVLDFFPRILKHSKGEWAGRPFTLSKWQQFLIGALFGWQRRYGQCGSCEQWIALDAAKTIDCIGCGLTDERPAAIGYFRRFRVAYIEIARKNGKTTIIAGIGILLAFVDDEAGAEVYAAATKRDQAKIAWSDAKRMVKASPSLRKRVAVLAANLNVEDRAQKFEPLGADADNMDGLNVHGGLIDEYHAHKTSAVYDVLDTAKGSRRQPLIAIITTAGNDRQSPCWAQHEYADKVLSGVFDDDSFFAFVAGLDEGDDWKDEKVWIKANPNLGVSVKVEDLRQQVERAARLPANENATKQKRLNIWTQQFSRWIPIDLWDENAGKAITESKFRGRTAFGGLDLGAVNDCTAWVIVLPRKSDHEKLDVIARFWVPEARLYAEDNRYRDKYQQWVREGWLLTTPGEATDYAFVRKQILKDASFFRLIDMNVDRNFQAHQLATELIDEGIEVIGMGQGFSAMASPMQELYRRLILGKIRHGGNPVLRWMADNVAVKRDEADNLRPDKRHSQGKIDGIVALVMGMDRAMRHEDGESVYERREVREVGA